jgi:hypothetical protein
MGYAIAGCLLYLMLWLGIGWLVAWGIVWAWDALVPSLFHGPSIDFTQALALYFLASLVIGGIRAILSVRAS